MIKVLPRIQNAHDPATRNIINATIDSTNAQGKSIQDLVAKGQLTPTQYANLIEYVNALIKKGQIILEDLSPGLRTEINKLTTQVPGKAEQMDLLEIESRIDNIIANAGNGNVPTELIDLRVGNEGKTFDTAGKRINADMDSIQKGDIKQFTHVNIYNYNLAEFGYIDASGNHVNNEAFRLSWYIECKPNTTYSTKVPTPYVGFYSGDNTWVSTTIGSNGKFTTPSNARFMRVIVGNDAVNYTTNMVVEGDTLPTSYIPYEYVEINENNVNMEKYDNSIISDFNDKIFTSVNLYDYTKATNGYPNADGTMNTSASFKVSDYIEYEPDTIYATGIAAAFVGFWDKNYVWIERKVATDGTFRTPSTPGYMRVTVGNNDVDYTTNMVVESTDYPSSFIAFKEKFKFNTKNIEINATGSSSESNLSGKKGGFLGDSITEGLKTSKIYYEYIADDLGIIPTAYGISGTDISTGGGQTTLAMVNRFVNMSNDFDFVSVFGGTNDYGHNVPLGNETDSTKSTFYGALNVLMNGLIDKYPGKPIIFFTPIQRGNYEGANDAGHTLLDYVDAVINRGAYYSIPVKDMYREGHLYAYNETIRTTYIPDGTHPNTPGHKIMSVPMKHAINKLF